MTGKEARQKLDILIAEIESKKSELDNLLGAARQISGQMTSALNDSNTKLTSITTNEQTAAQKLQTVEQNLVTIKSKEGESKNIAESINKINELAQSKSNNIEELRLKTQDLLNKNNEQSEKISDMLQKAAAGSLFNSFNIRKKEHEKSSRFWMIVIVVNVIVLSSIASWLAWMVHSKGILSYEFLIKTSVSFPIIYLLTLSTRQYTKSKRLEEEYAFKSAISLSLEAYRDLIKKESGEPTKGDVIPLITDAVGKIFSSPSAIISQQPDEEKGIEMGMLEKAADIFKKFIK